MYKGQKFCTSRSLVQVVVCRDEPFFIILFLSFVRLNWKWCYYIKYNIISDISFYGYEVSEQGRTSVCISWCFLWFLYHRAKTSESPSHVSRAKAREHQPPRCAGLCLYKLWTLDWRVGHKKKRSFINIGDGWSRVEIRDYLELSKKKKGYF